MTASPDGPLGGHWRTFEDLAFVIAAYGDNHLTARSIATSLPEDSQRYVGAMACAPDEAPIDSFMEDASFWDVAHYDHQRRIYRLGKTGCELINRSLEQRL